MAIEAEQIERATEVVSELARHDVSGLTHAEFLTAFEAVSRLGRLTDALRARFAGDLARRSTPELPGGGLARAQGFGNAAAMVAKVTGGSQAGAWRAIEAGLALTPVVTQGEFSVSTLASADDDPSGLVPAGECAADAPVADPPLATRPRYPAVAQATLAGELSVDAAGLITSGLETLTDRVPNSELHALESRLVAKAAGLTAHEVRRLVTVAVARADVGGLAERERRQYEQRYFAWAEDHTGIVTFNGRMDAVTAAPIRTAIEQVVTHQYRARRDQDPFDPDQRTVGQMRADALFELCRHALGCRETDRSGVRTTIVVRIDKTDVDAGEGAGSGVGTIDGTAVPVSVGELRRLAGDAGIMPAVLGGDSEVLDLGRKVRMFTTAQRLALLERDGGCAKCHAPPEHCEAHHITWWERGGRTDLSNGVMLCTRCHHDVHRHGWTILVRAGRVEFVPPEAIDDLRRPRVGGRSAITLSPTADARGTGEGAGLRGPPSTGYG